MFGTMIRRLSRRPWSLAVVTVLAVLAVAAYFLAAAGEGSLFGIVIEVPRSTPTPRP